MKKLDEATKDIEAEHEQKIERLQAIVDDYGSVEAYKAHLDEMKKAHADDMASALHKEQ